MGNTESSRGRRKAKAVAKMKQQQTQQQNQQQQQYRRPSVTTPAISNRESSSSSFESYDSGTDYDNFDNTCNNIYNNKDYTRGGNNNADMIELEDQLFDVSLEVVSDLHTKMASVRWTPSEDAALTRAVQKYDGKNWKLIAEEVPGRTHFQCLQHWRKVLRPGLIKGHWSAKEDTLLLQLVGTAQTKNWARIARSIPGRTAKQCRERWSLNLDPTINRGPWSKEEDTTLLALQDLMGNKWADISQRMPGRTENAVKTRFKSLTRTHDKEWAPEEDTIIIDAKLEENKRWLTIAALLPRRSRHAVKKRWQELIEANPELEKVLIERFQKDAQFDGEASDRNVAQVRVKTEGSIDTLPNGSCSLSPSSAHAAHTLSSFSTRPGSSAMHAATSAYSNRAGEEQQPQKPNVYKRPHAGSLDSSLDWNIDDPPTSSMATPNSTPMMYMSDTGGNDVGHHENDVHFNVRNIKSEYNEFNDSHMLMERPPMPKSGSMHSVTSLSGYFQNALESAAMDPVFDPRAPMPIRRDSGLKFGPETNGYTGDSQYFQQQPQQYQQQQGHSMNRRASADAVAASMGMRPSSTGVQLVNGVATFDTMYDVNDDALQAANTYTANNAYARTHSVRDELAARISNHHREQNYQQHQNQQEHSQDNGQEEGDSRRRQLMVSRSASERWRAAAYSHPTSSSSTSAAGRPSLMQYTEMDPVPTAGSFGGDGSSRSIAAAAAAATSDGNMRSHMMKKRTSSTPSIGWLADMPASMLDPDAWAASEGSLSFFDNMLDEDEEE